MTASVDEAMAAAAATVAALSDLIESMLSRASSITLREYTEVRRDLNTAPIERRLEKKKLKEEGGSSGYSDCHSSSERSV